MSYMHEEVELRLNAKLPIIRGMIEIMERHIQESKLATMLSGKIGLEDALVT